MTAAADGAEGIPVTAVNRTPAPLTRPVVDTQVIAFGPTEAFADEWWSAPGAHSDVLVQVLAAGVAPRAAAFTAERRSLAGRIGAFFAGLFDSARSFLAFAN